jgi:hypothetical protein
MQKLKIELRVFRLFVVAVTTSSSEVTQHLDVGL